MRRDNMMLPEEFECIKKIPDGDGQFHEVTLPAPPKDKKKITNWNLPIDKQKWKAVPVPDDIESWSREDQEAYQIDVLKKRDEGVFFYNGGNIEYLTGPHWFYVNFWQLDSGLPLFNDSDRDDFYLWKKAWDEPECLGTLEITNRRQGKTFRSLCKLYEKASKSYKAHCGIQSKTGPDAKTAFDKLILSWKELHWILKPEDSGDTNPAKTLEFREPSKRSSKGAKKTYKDVLNTKIDFRPSVETAYDGTKQLVYIDDEFGKGVECDVVTRWRIVKECLKVGKKVVGKSIHITTCEEMEAGGEGARILWDESNFAEGLAHGRTMPISGLLRRFKPGYVGLQGFIDEFGYSVVEDPEKPVMGQDGELVTIGAKTHLINERKGKSGAALASDKRKYPFSIGEAFMTDGKLTPFDIIKLNDQFDFNTHLPKDKIVTGNFKWSSQAGKIVEFVHNPQGRWNISWMPPENDRNKTTFEKGVYRPSNYRLMTSGVDPFDHKTTTDNRKSNGASYVFRKFDVLNPYSSNMFVSEYVNRPAFPEAFYEDMAMQSVFYGTELLCENNKIGLIRWFENNGFYAYLMDRPDVTHTEWSKARQKEKGVPMSGAEARQAVMNEMETYVYKSVGTNDETQEMGLMLFNKLVKCLINFDPNKWTDYDEFVGAGLALVATKRYSPKKVEVKGAQYFKTYDIRRNY